MFQNSWIYGRSHYDIRHHWSYYYKFHQLSVITTLLPFIAVTCLVSFHYLLSLNYRIRDVMYFQMCL